MVIEHSFVTTLDAPETMRRAMAFLEARGFTNAAPVAFQLNTSAQWNALEMRRGKKSAERAKSISELPQSVHLTWDRGRVGVALNIIPSSQLGGTISPLLMFGLIGLLMMRNAGSSDNPKKMKLHQEMLISIANGLERTLVQNQPAETAAADWAAVEVQIEEDRRKRARRNWIVLAVVVALFAGVIILAVTLS